MTDPTTPVIPGNATDVAGSPWLADPEWPAPTPEPARAPGVYSGVYPDLVMTAYVDENGAMVKVPKVKVPVVVDAPPPIDLAAIPEATP